MLILHSLNQYDGSTPKSRPFPTLVISAQRRGPQARVVRATTTAVQACGNPLTRADPGEVCMGLSLRPNQGRHPAIGFLAAGSLAQIRHCQEMVCKATAASASEEPGNVSGRGISWNGGRTSRPGGHRAEVCRSGTGFAGFEPG